MTKTVLIVDDDKMLRETLALGLSKADFNVIKADSAEKATKLLDRISVNVIILDRMMSGCDGIQFLKQLRSKLNYTPVLMLTALSGAENTIIGLSYGADDYMSKPFHLQELILRINNLIKKNNNSNKELPSGLIYNDNEFYVNIDNQTKLFALSTEEKLFLKELVNPIGKIVSASPMIAKRLRYKINSVLSNVDIVTIRGSGYKMVETK